MNCDVKIKCIDELIDSYPDQPTYSDLKRFYGDDANFDLLLKRNRNFGDGLMEGLIIALFTTDAGLQVLEFWNKHLSQPKLKSRNQEHTESNSNFLATIWRDNEYIFFKFVNLLLTEKELNITKSQSVRDLELFKFIFINRGSKFIPTNLIKKDQNLLKDYLTALCPKALDLLKGSITGRTIDDSLFIRTLKTYRRSHAFLRDSTFFEQQGEIDFTETVTNFLEIVTMDTNVVEKIVDGVQNIAYDAYFTSDIIVEQSVSIASNNKNMMQYRDGDDEVFSFDLNEENLLDMPDLMYVTALRHEVLFKVIFSGKEQKQINPQLLKVTYDCMSSLVDPLSQPAPNDKDVISIDLLYQMFMGFMHPLIKKNFNMEEGCDWKFVLAFNMYQILIACTNRLNCANYSNLNTVENLDEWETDAHLWLPSGVNTQHLELLYMNCIFAAYTIYKLYSDKPVQFNPFLPYFITLWRNLFCVLLFGTHVSRKEEDDPEFETPLLIKANIRGSAALRAVVATIINNFVTYKKHDFKHISFNTFMSPHGRKLCDGSLSADMKAYTACMWALGRETKELVDLFVRIRPGDFTDENVSYIFDYEYENYNYIDSDENDSISEGEEYEAEFDQRIRRCECIISDNFSDQKPDLERYLEEDELSEIPDEENVVEGEQEPAIDKLGSKSKNVCQFDHNGNDWRDVARGTNLYYNLDFQFFEKPLLKVVTGLSLKASVETLENSEALLLLRSVASAVKNENDWCSLNISDADSNPKLDLVKPDHIYQMWSEGDIFSGMLRFNATLALCLLDEMMMSHGCRRLLIWLITHLEVDQTIISYIFSLALGMRGLITSDAEPVFPFSRQGPIVLSKIETDMLFQEFFTNATILFSKNAKISNDDSEVNENDEEDSTYSMYDIGLMQLTCSLLHYLLNSNKFDIKKLGCVFEMQALLLNWVTILPAAKELMFTIRSQLNSGATSDSENDGKESKSTIDSNDKASQNTFDYNQYNKNILSLLPKKIPKSNFGNKEYVRLYSEYIKNYSFDKLPLQDRRLIIHDSDVILPLTTAKNRTS